jgi:hypothetical protein
MGPCPRASPAWSPVVILWRASVPCVHGSTGLIHGMGGVRVFRAGPEGQMGFSGMCPCPTASPFGPPLSFFGALPCLACMAPPG